MAGEIDIKKQLQKERGSLSREDELLKEAERILVKGRLSEKNILDNLKFYNSSFEFLDDEELEGEAVYSIQQLKNVCTKLRLRFLSSQSYTGEIPYEALLKIKDLNKRYGKDLKHFKVLASEKFFLDEARGEEATLFAQTLYGNYYAVHSWGKPHRKSRKARFYFLRSFETLLFCLLAFSLFETMVLPTRLITTDARATYFSMYRIACVFHLLIFNAGFTVFALFGFHLNFSGSMWDVAPKRKKM